MLTYQPCSCSKIKARLPPLLRERAGHINHAKRGGWLALSTCGTVLSDFCLVFRAARCRRFSNRS